MKKSTYCGYTKYIKQGLNGEKLARLLKGTEIRGGMFWIRSVKYANAGGSDCTVHSRKFSNWT